MRVVRYMAATVFGALAGLTGAWADERKSPTEWQYWEGRHYRLEADGNISCYGDGGRHPVCITGSVPPDPATAKPLSCGSLMWEDGQGRKTTGYQIAGHWCNNAYANLFATWQSYKSLGYDVKLATNPRGDVMCQALDATTCLPGGLPKPLSDWPAPSLSPVVCGRAMQMRASITGYDDPKHWCSTPEIVLMEKDLSLEPARYNGPQYPDSPPRRRIALAGWQSTERPTWILRYIAPNRTTTEIMLKLRGFDGKTYPKIPWNIEEDGIRYASIANTPEGVHINTTGSESSGFRAVRFDDEGRGTLAIRVTEKGWLEFVQAAGWPKDPFVRKSGVMSEMYLTDKPSSPTVGFWRYSEKDPPHNTIDVIAVHKGGYDGGNVWRHLPPTFTELLMTRTRQLPPL